jgi:Spy/CpxP family protein refolding chaperone
VSPWKVILATMVIFVCGVVTGALVVRTQGWRPASPSGFGGPGPFMPRLVQQLGLTREQHDKIDKIMQTEKERAQQAITQVLTPEQQRKFSELLKKPEQRPEGRGRRGGEGGGFPRNTNRFQTNGFPEEGRGRTGRRGQYNNFSTNSPSTNSPSTNNPAANSPATNAP